MLEASGVNGICERDSVLRAFDIRDGLFLGGRLEVVDGGEMEKVPDLSVELRNVFGRNSEHRLRQVAEHCDRARVVDTPVRQQRADLLWRTLLADQEIDDRATMREEP